MTAVQLLRVLARRWYVLALVATVTGIAILLSARVPGVYWTQVDVVFLPPKSANALEDQNTSIVQFAAVIERAFNGTQDAVSTASSSGTLYGEGVRSGWQVSLPNNGGQWQNNFNRPSLSIEVVESSPRTVSAVAASLSGRVGRLVQQRQEGIGIAPENRVTTIESPDSPVVRYVQGSDTRAAIAHTALGLVIGVLAAVQFDRLLARSPKRRPKRRLGRRQQDPESLPKGVLPAARPRLRA